MRKDFTPFTDEVYPCYSIRALKEKDELHVLRDNRCIQKFKISSFPKELDFKKPETIYGLLKTIRHFGCFEILTMYPEVKTISLTDKEE